MTLQAKINSHKWIEYTEQDSNYDWQWEAGEYTCYICGILYSTNRRLMLIELSDRYIHGIYSCGEVLLYSVLE